jgi:putative endonuclease
MTPEEREYYVYILANTFHRMYVGVTSGLRVRVNEHKQRVDPGSFTARYGIDRLVYFERFAFVEGAIRREKEIKGWLRVKKIALVVACNPTWRDLSEDWGGEMEVFEESRMRPPKTF